MPLLVNPPAPVTPPFSVKVVPEATLTVFVKPLPNRVNVRLVENDPVVARVPPANFTAPDKAPKLASAETCSVPALRVVPPEYVLRPAQCQCAAR